MRCSLKKISILGTRGVPAGHGGFETFAARLAPYLVSRGWQVTVYCQEEGSGNIFEDDWEGVYRVHIPVTGEGPASTIRFRSEEHTSELQSLMRISYAVFCLTKKNKIDTTTYTKIHIQFQ